MQVGFLITNGGTHDASKWAAATASQIIQIAADASGEQAIAGRKLELRLLDILETYHGKVQDEEKGHLERVGAAYYETPLGHDDCVEACFQEILAASKGTLFESHFAREDVQNHVKEVVHRDFATVQEIERKWHKDNHPFGAKN
jgi:hypothetical protein